MKATTDVVGQYFDPAPDKVRAQLEIAEKARRKLDNDRMNEQHEAKARAREAMAGAGLKSSLFGERDDPKADVPEANALRERVVQEEVDQELDRMREELDGEGAQPESETEKEEVTPEEAGAEGSSGVTYAPNEDGSVDAIGPHLTDAVVAYQDGLGNFYHTAEAAQDADNALIREELAQAEAGIGMTDGDLPGAESIESLARKLELAKEVMAAQAIAQAHLMEIYEPGRLAAARKLIDTNTEGRQS